MRLPSITFAIGSILIATVFFVGCDGLSSSGYTSDMAISIELTDPETGLVVHDKLEERMPVLMRELDRVTQEPLLRQTLNKPSVQSTQWFAQFNNNLDEAFDALHGQVISAAHVEGTGLIKIYATTPQQDDSQIILRALGDEYMRLKAQAENAAFTKMLQAAHERRDDAEQRLISLRVQAKRFRANAGSETVALPEELSSEIASAETEREKVVAKISEIIEIEKRGGGVLGYRVLEEYPPQKAK